MARFLPSRYKVSCVLAESRYKLSGDHFPSPGAECGSKALVQCRGTSLGGATFESRCSMLLAGSGAYPGTTILKNLSQRAGLNCKNRDKFFNSTVRVSCQLKLLSQLSVIHPPRLAGLKHNLYSAAGVIAVQF